MRPIARLLLAAALAALPIGVALTSCGTDAVAVDACRQIETARCNAAPACSPGFDVTSCTRFYRDECLVGIGNADAGDVTALIQPCILALQACANPDAAAEAGCPGYANNPTATCFNSTDGGLIPEPTACEILMECPEVLQACNWVAVVAVTTDAGDAGDAADAEDAADSGDATDQ